MAASDWSNREVEAIVRDYLDMLASELRGQSFNKAEHNRALRQQLNDRSPGSVEFKHQNISWLLFELGHPYIKGYKPRRNIQDLLRREVLRQLARLSDLVSADVEASPRPIAIPDILDILVDPPQPANVRIPATAAQQVRARQPAGTTNYFAQEARNQSLREAGERLIMTYERTRLCSAGEARLAEKVDHVSKTVGDHAGYDIRSFEVSGRERLIEVKTTRYGKETPFLMSAGEVRFSKEHAAVYQIYRLFQFRQRPKLFTLPGDVQRHVRLEALTFRAHFVGGPT